MRSKLFLSVTRFRNFLGHKWAFKVHIDYLPSHLDFIRRFVCSEIMICKKELKNLKVSLFAIEKETEKYFISMLINIMLKL